MPQKIVLPLHCVRDQSREDRLLFGQKGWFIQKGKNCVKGKRQPPICKEGDTIKEGQVIGYLDQFGSELPIKSNVAGEVLKLLYNDGDAMGFGDPLVAVLPSFHGIK